MSQTEKEINGKKYILKELRYKDMAALAEAPKIDGLKQMIILSTEMSEEEYKELSLKDGVELQKVINELNGLNSQDFQQPLTQ